MPVPPTKTESQNPDELLAEPPGSSESDDSANRDLDDEKKCGETILGHIESELRRRKLEEAADESGDRRMEPAERATSSRFDLQRAGAEILRPIHAKSKKGKEKKRALWAAMRIHAGLDTSTIQRHILSHVEHTLGRPRFGLDVPSCYLAVALSLRDRMAEAFHDSSHHFFSSGAKQVYQFSLDPLQTSVSLPTALSNMGLESQYRAALEELGIKLEDLAREQRVSMGRPKVVFDSALESMATLNYPATVYGVRFESEEPLRNPWEAERSDVTIKVGFGGKVEKGSKWVPEEFVQAEAYDSYVPGYNSFATNGIRVWRALPLGDCSFRARKRALRLVLPTSILSEGAKEKDREWHLRQQYFLAAASVADVLRRFRLAKGGDWSRLPEKAAIQLSDSRCAIAIVELFRVLIDECELPYAEAMATVSRTFSFTCSANSAEGLEKWDVPALQHVLPRHLELIYLMNYNFLESVKTLFKGSTDMTRRLSWIEESEPKKVRAANICMSVCRKTCGVSSTQTETLRSAVLKEFVEYFHKTDEQMKPPGERVLQVSAGVSPRICLLSPNPKLSELITRNVGSDRWVACYEAVKSLEAFAHDETLHREWTDVRKQNKARLRDWTKQRLGITVREDSLFSLVLDPDSDESRRTLMSVLFLVQRYIWIKSLADTSGVVPRTIFVVGCGRICKLIRGVAETINGDAKVAELIKVVAVPEYDLEAARMLVPAVDICEQLAVPGSELADSTGMMFAMNGCLLLGSMDGSNIEMAQEIGKGNTFGFGGSAAELALFRKTVFAVY